MTELHNVTVDLDEIRARATAVSQVRLNKNTTPEDEMHLAMYNLQLAIDECRLAEFAIRVEQNRTDQNMADAGYDIGGLTGEEGEYGPQMLMFREYADKFTRQIAAIQRVLDDRNERDS